MTTLTIAGGVALILFSVRFLRKGFDRLFGSQFGAWLKRSASKPWRAFTTGLGVSMLTPSSTSMSIFAVQAVQAGHINMRQTLAIMFGADIGLTITIQLASLNIDQFVPVFLLVGIVLFQFMHSARLRGIGQVVLSLGFLFLGVGMIKAGARGIGANNDLIALIQLAEHYPVALMILAALLSLLLQSSTATIGLLIGVAASGTIDLPLPIAVAVVLGANLGIGLTMLVVAWSHTESRRLAFGNLLIKLAVCALALALLPQIVDWVQMLRLPLSNQVAMTHTGFNVFKALLGLPLIGLVSALSVRCIPGAAEKQAFGPKYINNGPIEGIALAEGQSMREIMRVAELVRAMLDDLWHALKTNDEKLVREISARDDQVDLLDAEIKGFLTRLAAQGLDHDQAAEQMRQLRYLAELETVGDIIDKNLCELTLKKIKLGVDFSKEGWVDLDDLFGKVKENAFIADTAFHIREKELAQKLLEHKNVLDSHVISLRDRHFARLNAGLVESHVTSAIHLDLLTNLKRINSHVTHVAYALLQGTQSVRSRRKKEKALPAPAAQPKLPPMEGGMAQLTN